MAEPLRIDIWSDIACPWCYVGKRRLEAALARFRVPDAPPVEVVWRSFQLDSSAPRVVPASLSYTERLAKKYGTSPAQAQAMIARMVETAAAEAIAMDFEHIKPGNTFDAHRLLHWAAARGAQDALKERFFRAYLCEGQPIGEPEVLVRLTSEVGLDPDEARGVVATDAYATEVHADIAVARELGISGVPFFVFAQRYEVSGAQNADTLLSVFQKVRAELGAGQTRAEGEVCGPDSCNTSAS